MATRGLPPSRQSNLGVIIAAIAAVQLLGLLLDWLLGPLLFTRLAEAIDTRGAVLIALLIYSVIAVWGFFLNSVIEFWFLAWMVSVVQGGSQALSRSLFSQMIPPGREAEFFSFYEVSERGTSWIGPFVFGLVNQAFGSLRLGILSVIVLFIVGLGVLLTVDVPRAMREAGRAGSPALQPAAD